MKTKSFAALALSLMTSFAFADRTANQTWANEKIEDAKTTIRGEIEQASDEARKEFDDANVTFSFDVWANDISVPAGDVSNMDSVVKAKLEEIYGPWILKETVKKAIPINRKEMFTIRSITMPEKNQTAIDWGDGHVDRIRLMSWTEGENFAMNEGSNEVFYVMSHTYATAGVYTIKFIGEDWHAITPQLSRKMGYVRDDSSCTNNLACRVFNLNHHDAAHVKNYSNMFNGALRLFSVNGRYNYPLRFGHNAAGTFRDCANLIDFGFFFYKGSSSTLGSVFSGCQNLKGAKMPYKLPRGRIESIANIFNGCSELSIDIGKLILVPFENDQVEVQSAFKNCAAMTGTVPANLLWNDTSVRWLPDSLYANGVSNDDGPFVGCSQEIREQVPVSWGGLNTEIQVPEYSGPGRGGSYMGSAKNIAKALDPTVINEMPIDETGEFDFVVDALSNSLTTIMPTNEEDLVGTEMCVRGTSSRNFRLFFPNEETVRSGLPFTINKDFEGDLIVKFVNTEDDMRIDKLPVMVQVDTPYPGKTFMKIEAFDEGDSWDPVVTELNYMPNEGVFTCGNALYGIVGTNLHSCTNIFLTYPTSASETMTKQVVANPTGRPLSGSLYKTASSGLFQDITASDLYYEEPGKTWFKIIYMTTHGTTEYRAETQPPTEE